jgi:hypothetical protein
MLARRAKGNGAHASLGALHLRPDRRVTGVPAVPPVHRHFARERILPGGTLNPGAAFSLWSIQCPGNARSISLSRCPVSGRRTLRDAASYIRKLPESQRDTPEWRLAIQMLLDAAENCGPMLFARMGIERAVERTHGASSTARAPMASRGRRKLKRV